ncbi:MAG: exonuclease domain-containing protein [Gemmatimonadota bacterium]
MRRANPDQLALLPADLLVDTSDRSRGIRITLNRAGRMLPLPIDCAGSTRADTPIRSLEYAIVDVETTGGSWGHGHRITDIAAVRLRGDGTVVDEYRTLINPERSIPAFITKLTNITPAMVRDAPVFRDAAPHIARVLGGAIFVAHNAAFDWHFVGAEFERAGVPLRGRTLCTVNLARKVVPELRSRSLDSLVYFFDIPVEQRHRAYGDAVATAELFRRLLDRLDTHEVTLWNELQTLLAQRARRKKRKANPQPMPEGA